MSTPAWGGEAVFACEGEMAARCAAFDWAATPLGPVSDWSDGLCSTVAILLRSQFPMCLSWGEDLVLLYNDAFIPTLGGKHPAALGVSIAVVFEEIWEAVGHRQLAILQGGASTFEEDLPLVLERGTGPEETFYTFSYSHVPDLSSGARGPGGVLAVVAESTRAVVGARRIGVLNALATSIPDLDDPLLAVRAGLRVLGGAEHDLHRGAYYVPRPDGTLDLAGSFGDAADWPALVAAADDGALQRARRDDEPVVEVLAPHDDTDRARRSRVVLPVRSATGSTGVLVLDPHPQRPLDDEHHRFLGLVVEHVGHLLGHATVRADEHHRLAALAAADEAKTTFLSNVSHEFRTPLTLLLGPLEDALARGDGEVDAADLRAMHRNAHRLLRMVNGLLEVTRVGADARTAAVEATDVAALTDDLLQPFRPAADRAGLELRTALDAGLGNVEVDPLLWEAIVLNLTANALKYTLEGSIDVRLRADGGDLVLTVADTGLGIAAEEQPRVFDRFHRVTGPHARTIEGTGVGLALVDEAARAHGGTVGVTSVPGEGSTFEVRLPLVASDPAGDAVRRARADRGARSALAEDVVAVVEPSPAGPSTGADDELVVVVADDNADLRRRLSSALSEIGRVVPCADGREALAAMRARPVDLLVTDVMMPEVDGIALLREVRGDPDLAATPVVLVSARAGADAATEALEHGADDYVVKPFTRAELVARCRTTVELASLRTIRAAQAARTTMLAGISHDMQTPLSVVTAVLEMLETATSDDVRRRLVARGAARAAELEGLIAQFLDWARLSVGAQIAPTLEPVDLSGLLDDVVRHHDRAVLPVLRPRTVLCDRGRTQRILDNLLTNASTAARDVVQVQVTDVDRAVEVHVVDDGAGVDSDVLPYLFSAFGPTGSPVGSGLGLHVSRAAARAQGGDLVLDSTGASGSRFVLRLPTGA